MHHIPAFYGKKMQQNKQLNYHIKRFAQTQPSNMINHKRKYEKIGFLGILGWMVYGSDVFRGHLAHLFNLAHSQNGDVTKSPNPKQH